MYSDVLPMFFLIILAIFFGFPLYVLIKLGMLTKELTELKTWQEIHKPLITALHREIALLKQSLMHISTEQAVHEQAVHEFAGTVEREATPPAVTTPPKRDANPLTTASSPLIPSLPSHVPRTAQIVSDAPARRTSAAPAHPEVKPLPPAVPPLPSVQKPVPAVNLKELESLLGANWLAKLGIAAIAVAVAFFLQYAFRSGMIGPSGQVAIGLCGSAVMLGAGQYLLKKEPYRAYAQVLASGGIIVFFLSIYAAYGFYQPRLLGYVPAFAILAIGALAASVLALANKTEGVAILCILGAFAAPVLIREGGTGAPQPESLLRLYAYLAVLNIWVVGLLRFRSWHSLTIISFASTWLLFYNAAPLRNAGWATEGFAALFLLFSCYMGVRGIYAQPVTATNGEPTELPDTAKAGLGLIVGGCVAFACASLMILNKRSAGLPDASFAGMVTALVLSGFAAALPKLPRMDREIRLFLGCLSPFALILMLGASVGSSPPPPPEHLPAAFGFTLFNFLLFLAMSFVLHRRPEQQHAAAALCAGNVLIHVVMAHQVLQAVSFWNIPAAAFWMPLAGGILLGGVWFAARQHKEVSLLRATLILAAHILPLYGLIVMQGTSSTLMGAAVFAGEFVLVSATGIALRRELVLPEHRAELWIAFSNAAIFFGLIARSVGTAAYPHSGVVMLAAWAIGMAVYHAFVGGMMIRKPSDDKLHRLIYLGLAVTFISIAIPLQLKASYIPFAWAVQATILMWTGKATRERSASIYGLVLLALAASKAVCFDLLAAPVNFHFLLNTRMLAGASVIAGAYISAWLLWQERNKEANSNSHQPNRLGNNTIAALLVTASVLTLLFVSFDIVSHVTAHWAGVEQQNIQQFALSVFWAAYAVGSMAFGIRLQMYPLRLLAFGLLALAALKALTLDIRTRPEPLLLLLNTRMMAGAALILAASLIAWLFRQNRADISEEEHSVSALLGVLANAFTLLFVSVDLWEYTGQQLLSAGQVSAQHLALSVFWTVYALVGVSVGIWKRLRTVRLFGMGLLYFSIAKVFLFDLSQLEPLYRIFSFFTLGIILLLVSYLYTRFEAWLGSEAEPQPTSEKVGAA